jgi:hypothetical protein
MRLTASGPVAPATAWQRYVVLAEWPTWAGHIASVEADGDRLRPGLRGRVSGPFGVGVTFVVTAVDEAGRTWSWDVRWGPIELHLDHDVTARAGGGTRTGLELDGPAPVLLGYAPVARLALQRLVSSA